jgi:DNA-binding CsgD family transcriptional regulator
LLDPSQTLEPLVFSRLSRDSCVGDRTRIETYKGTLMQLDGRGFCTRPFVLKAAILGKGAEFFAEGLAFFSPRDEDGVGGGVDEVEVLALIARGLSNKDIARVLAASEFTVKAHVRNVLAKLGVETRIEAAILAVQRGLVQI